MDDAIAALVRRQHGVIARAQLLRLGLGRHTIGHRLERRLLHPLHRGVYAVGHDRVSREGRWMAAVLAAGPGAVLSHRSAAARRKLAGEGGLIEVTTRHARHARPGIAFHRARLPRDEITIEDGIPVTSVPRTLFDIAAVLPARQLERALNQAEVLRLWDELSLVHLLARYPRRPGCRAIRAALQQRRAGATVTRSELEVLFLEFLDDAGLPRPETNVLVEGFEVDCVWRARRLAVELDGRGVHDTSEAFERDRERDRVLQAAGWRPVRVTWRQLRFRPDSLRADLERLIASGP